MQKEVAAFLGGVDSLGALVASFFDYSRFSVTFMEALCNQTACDKFNVEAYIDMHLCGQLPMPDNQWLVFQAGKCVHLYDKAAEVNLAQFSWQCTVIQHKRRKEYFESFPAQPEMLNLAPKGPDDEYVVAQYFRVMHPPQHLMSPQWQDALYFPQTRTRVTINSHGFIYVHLCTEPEYKCMDFYKPLQVPRSLLTRLEEYGLLDLQRQAIYHTLVNRDTLPPES